MLVFALNLFQNVSCTFVIKAILFSLTPRELYAILHEYIVYIYVCIIFEFFSILCLCFSSNIID